VVAFKMATKSLLFRLLFTHYSSTDWSLSVLSSLVAAFLFINVVYKNIKSFNVILEHIELAVSYSLE
jgi:hypothetical protein